MTRARAALGGLAAIVIAAAVALPQLIQRTPQIDLLLLVTVDTLRADHLGAYGSPDNLTPTLDALAGESKVFTRAYAVAPFTLPSVTAMQTGRYPRELGILGNKFVLPEGARTLAQVLRENGWHTGAVVSNYVLRKDTGLSRGFDVYDDRFTQLEAHRPLPERAGPDTTTAAIALLDRFLGQPEKKSFLWVHYQDPHGPYTPPGAGRAKHIDAERGRPDGQKTLPLSENEDPRGAIPRYQFEPGESEVAYYRAGYKGEVEFVDAEIGRLLAAVGERVPRQRTALLLTADHGEALGEDDYWFGHGLYLNDALVHVPMLIRAPGTNAERRTDAVSLVDVRPTLLALAGIPGEETRGRDLLAWRAAHQNPTVYVGNYNRNEPRTGLVTRDHKYVVTTTDPAAPPREELFPPGSDERDLAAERPAIIDEMRREFLRIHAEVPNAPSAERKG